MIVNLMNEHLLECLSLEGGCRGSSESTHVEMLNCWKSHTLAQLVLPVIPAIPFSVTGFLKKKPKRKAPSIA